MREPAHSIFIKRHLDWGRVQERLGTYKHIAANFPLAKLQKCSKSPFYCHYLAWRLGTWENEELFESVDEWLEIATGLPGWQPSRIAPEDGEFWKFWSLLWELQTAAFFAKQLGLKNRMDKGERKKP